QYGAVGVERGRDGEDDLADVPGLLHVPEGVLGLPEVPAGARVVVQVSLGEQLQQVAEHLADPGRAGVTQVEGGVAGGPGAQVRFAHLDEAPAGLEEVE